MAFMIYLFVFNKLDWEFTFDYVGAFISQNEQLFKIEKRDLSLFAGCRYKKRRINLTNAPFL